MNLRNTKIINITILLLLLAVQFSLVFFGYLGEYLTTNLFLIFIVYSALLYRTKFNLVDHWNGLKFGNKIQHLLFAVLVGGFPSVKKVTQDHEKH
jgi:hypothetical protein